MVDPDKLNDKSITCKLVDGIGISTRFTIFNWTKPLNRQNQNVNFMQGANPIFY
jgi:hypothetical protein